MRGNDKGEIGFLADIRRTNVAITRARKKLIMTGDSATLGTNEFYTALLEYVQQKGFVPKCLGYSNRKLTIYVCDLDLQFTIND